MDRRAGGSLPEAKTANMRRAGTPYAKTRGALRTGSRRIQLRDRSNVKPEGRTESVAPGGILLHNTLGNREELRHIRQRIIGSSKIPVTLENVPCRSPTSNCYLHGPLEPPILEGTKKNQ